MILVWQLLGPLIVIAVTATGLVIMVAPETGRRMIARFTGILGLLLLGLGVIQFVGKILPHSRFARMVALWTASILAYLYCERQRPGKGSPRQSATSVERERVDLRGATFNQRTAGR